MNSLYTRKPQRRLIPFLLVSLGTLTLFSGLYLTQRPIPATASSGYLANAKAKYPGISGTRLDSCSLCHTSGSSLNLYGADYKSHGRDFAAIEGLDSDRDGFTNLQEITALKFPGDASDRPAAPPTATATNPRPTQTASPTSTARPTSTATLRPSPTNTSTNTPLPTNTATPLPTSTATLPPTNTSTPLPVLTNTPAISPSPTQSATALPQPTNTATNVPQPSATNPPPTQPPTATATSTQLPQPTATATIPPTPSATATLLPSPTLPPAPTPEGTPSTREVKLNPSADAYVAKSNPQMNFSSALVLRADADPLTRSFLRFDLGDLEPQTIQKLTLSLYVNSSSGSGFSINTVSGKRWLENRITYRNAPDIRKPIVSGFGSVGTWVTLDLTGLEIKDEQFTLGLAAREGAWNSFGSSESGAHAPVLTILTR